MSNHAETIKKDLVSLYTDLHLLSQSGAAANFFSKDMLKKLKYTPEEVREALEANLSVPEKNKQKMKEEITEIKTKEQVEAYFKEHLLPACQPDLTEEEKSSLLKKVTLEEIKHLYKIIFGIPLTDKCRKMDAVYRIKNFFDDVERIADLTKNFPA